MIPEAALQRRGPASWWAAIPRGRRIAAVVVGIVLFLAISGVLARFLAAEGVERDDVLAVLQAQAAGNAQGMLDRQAGCRRRPACVARTRANATSLRRPGALKILTLSSATAYALSGATGKTRVAWTVIGTPPVVQCVLVRRTGDFLQGISVVLLSISAPIPNEGDC